MGVSYDTYAQHENGTRKYKADKAQKYARFFRVTPEWLLYGRGKGDEVIPISSGPVLRIVGTVEAGMWREVRNLDNDELETFTGRPDIYAQPSQRFGLRVVGESMNLLYPAGSIVECVSYYGDNPIPNGKRVIVQRKRHFDGFETTVKEYQKDSDGIEWLVPKSSHPAFQSPFRVDQPEPGIEEVRIIAIVVAAIIPE